MILYLGCGCDHNTGLGSSIAGNADGFRDKLKNPYNACSVVAEIYYHDLIGSELPFKSKLVTFRLLLVAHIC